MTAMPSPTAAALWHRATLAQRYADDMAASAEWWAHEADRLHDLTTEALANEKDNS